MHLPEDFFKLALTNHTTQTFLFSITIHLLFKYVANKYPLNFNFDLDAKEQISNVL